MILLLLAATGVVAGALNVLAGGGSFLTLPVLIFVGLPASVANGTNRVGILAQNVGAVWAFDRHRLLDRKFAVTAALPAATGAVLGVRLALLVPDQAFERILATLMVGLTLWTLAHRRPNPATGVTPRPWLLGTGFFLVGIYGGFVQAGVGFLVLAATSLGGLDLVRGNAVKVTAILALTSVSLLLFVLEGRVSWPEGLALAVGTAIGGQIGVRLTVLKGDRWVRRVVAITVLAFAVKLWFTP